MSDDDLDIVRPIPVMSNDYHVDWGLHALIGDLRSLVYHQHTESSHGRDQEVAGVFHGKELQSLGQVYPDMLDKMTNLAITYWDQGRLEEVEKLKLPIFLESSSSASLRLGNLPQGSENCELGVVGQFPGGVWCFAARGFCRFSSPLSSL